MTGNHEEPQVRRLAILGSRTFSRDLSVSLDVTLKAIVHDTDDVDACY